MSSFAVFYNIVKFSNLNYDMKNPIFFSKTTSILSVSAFSAGSASIVYVGFAFEAEALIS